MHKDGKARARAMLGAMTLVLPLIACGDDETAPQAEAAPPAVVVSPAVEREVTASAEFVGRTEAIREVDLRARVEGFLEDRTFEEGQTVEEDQLLFVIDPAEFDAELKAAGAEVERALATREAAIGELERARKLVERGNISEAEVDQRAAEAGRAEADIKAAEAARTRAELDRGYTEIRAPFAGRIGASAYDVGNLVGPESGVLASVIALDPIYVTFPVSEREYLNYQKEENKPEVVPRIRLADGTVYEQAGEIAFIDNRVDPTTGTLQVRATFPNPDRLLLPGQYVDVLLTVGAPDVKTVVPQAAVQENQAGRFVLVVDADDRVEARPIVTGQRIDTDWVVESGLRPGERVIVEGVQKVRPGGIVDPSLLAPAGGGEAQG